MAVVVQEIHTDDTVPEWVLVTTRTTLKGPEVVASYALRIQIEERHRQFKVFWRLGEFTSPSFSLVVAHIVFLLLAYTLLQAYLHVKGLAQLARRAITTLQMAERTGRAAGIVYADGAFAIFDLLELLDIVVSLPEDTRRKPKCRISHLLRTRPPVS